MAANKVSEGINKTVLLTSGQTGFESGDFYLTGDIGGVILALKRNGQTVFVGSASAEGDQAVLAMTGVWRLPKIAATVINDGVPVYYDPATTLITPTAGSLKIVGWAEKKAESADATVDVRLKG